MRYGIRAWSRLYRGYRRNRRGSNPSCDVRCLRPNLQNRVITHARTLEARQGRNQDYERRFLGVAFFFPVAPGRGMSAVGFTLNANRMASSVDRGIFVSSRCMWRSFWLFSSIFRHKYTCFQCFMLLQWVFMYRCMSSLFCHYTVIIGAL